MTCVNYRVPFLVLTAVVSLLTAGQVSASHFSIGDIFIENISPFSVPGLFATKADQSQFSATTAITLNANEFYGVEFDTGPKLFGGIAEGGFGDLYGVEGSLDLAGKVGLQTQFTLNSGTVDVKLPYTVGLSRVSTIDGSLTAGSVTTTLFPIFAVDPSASFKSVFPVITFDADLIVKLDTSAKVTACFVDCFLNNVQLVPEDLRSIDVTTPLFGFNSNDPLDVKIAGIPVIDAAKVLLPPIPLEPGVFLIAKITTGATNSLSLAVEAGAITKKSKKPAKGVTAGTSVAEIFWTPIGDELNANYSGSADPGFFKGAALSNSVDFFTPTLDVDGILGVYSPLPPGGITFNAPGVSFKADLIDGDVGPSFGIKQVFDFDPNAKLELNFERPIGVSINGSAFNTQSQVTLTDYATGAVRLRAEREVAVIPTFTLSPELSNNLDLTLKPSLQIRGLSASLNVAGEDIFTLPPLLNIKPDLPEFTLVDLYDKQFKLENVGTQILKLPRFLIAKGLTQSGSSPDNPRDHTTINADGSVTTYKIDYGSKLGGSKEVQALLYKDNLAKIRTKTTDTCNVITAIIRGATCWASSTTYTTQTASETNRFGDLNESTGRDDLDSRATQISVASAEGQSASVPSEFKDGPISVGSISKSGTKNLGFFNIPFSLPGSQKTQTLFSDAYSKQDVKRGSGLGLDELLWLEFDLLSDAGVDGRVEFAQEFTFNLGIDKDPFTTDEDPTTGIRPYQREFVLNSASELTGLSFESFSIDGGMNSEIGKLLQAIGDTNGLKLVVNFDPDRFDFTDGNNGGTTQNNIEIVFNPLDGDYNFNFVDDFLSQPANFFGNSGSYNLLDGGLVTKQGMNAIDGIKNIKITGFDFSPSVFSSGFFTDTLFDRLELFGATTALNIGVTFDEMVLYDYNETTGELMTERRLDPLEADFDPVITGRVRAPGQASTTFVQRPPPVPTDVGPGTLPLNNVITTGTNNDACSAADCNGLTITVTQTDINTGTETTTTQSAETFLSTNQGSLTVLPEDTSALGTSAGRGLMPAAVAPGNSFIFDFATVPFWGQGLAYQDVVFSAAGTLTSGESCGASLPGLADQQVVGRVSPGGVPDVGTIDLNGFTAFQTSSCFNAQDTTLVFGQEAPVFLDLPFAPQFTFEVTEGPMFTSVSLPSSGGDNGLFQNDLKIITFDALGERTQIGRLSLGETFFFDTPVLKFLLANLAIDELLLDSDPGFVDTALTAVFGFTVTTAGTVITATASSAVPEPGTALLLMAGGALLLGRQRRRRCRLIK